MLEQRYQVADADYIQTAYKAPTEQRATSLVTLQPSGNLNAIVRNAGGIVLIDFYSDWCGPCRQQAKILHDMEA